MLEIAGVWAAYKADVGKEAVAKPKVKVKAKTVKPAPEARLTRSQRSRRSTGAAAEPEAAAEETAAEEPAAEEASTEEAAE